MGVEMNGKASDIGIDEIYFAAAEYDDPAARAAYLAEACGTDSDMRRQVERLLAARADRGSFLEAPVLGPTIEHGVGPIAEGPGTIIGPYKLREQIGEGGMGVVYVAEQTQPVRRKVALKIIKPGMDTKQVIARFEAERKALAMMDHPNIARVLDGGATESGRPYFVMELVRGMPVTDFCDRERLSIPERLELFILVCRAVQHAHQKGIIHRDLKPSNILVTVIDGVAVPRVIDFGVAKATGASLTERTLYTAFHQFVGTPLYMSPEQADLAGMDVDTRSDIYSLGVLLGRRRLWALDLPPRRRLRPAHGPGRTHPANRDRGTQAHVHGLPAQARTRRYHAWTHAPRHHAAVPSSGRLGSARLPRDRLAAGDGRCAAHPGAIAATDGSRGGLHTAGGRAAGRHARYHHVPATEGAGAGDDREYGLF
jgi:hypothetical protein